MCVNVGTITFVCTCNTRGDDDESIQTRRELHSHTRLKGWYHVGWEFLLFTGAWLDPGKHPQLHLFLGCLCCSCCSMTWVGKRVCERPCLRMRCALANEEADEVASGTIQTGGMWLGNTRAVDALVRSRFRKPGCQIRKLPWEWCQWTPCVVAFGIAY